MRTEEHSKEIEQESIKKQLNEIITDIERNVTISNDEVTESENLKKSQVNEKSQVKYILPQVNRVREFFTFFLL
jgi:hypothetical protein